MKKETHRDYEAPRRVSRRKKKSSKAMYYVLLVILLGILGFSTAKIVSYLSQQRASEQSQANIINEFVREADPVQSQSEENGPAGGGGEEQTSSGEVAAPATPEPDQISVDLDSMRAKYPDVVGYIYAANTGIKYPIVKGGDNDFYLTHDIDGNKNNNGSIFMETLCNADFSSGNTIIYGHHMKSGRMFAALENYKSQSYYDVHPYMYIYTPNGDYRLDLFAGCVVEGDADIYSLSVDSGTLSSYVAKSTFKSKIGTPSGNIVTLSTCDYTSGYSDPRYVVLGQLVPIG